jgi:CBS domain-containing protein
MTPNVQTVAPETPLREVAELLADNRISGAPVLDAHGRVVGVVSEADVVSSAAGDARRGPLRFLHDARRLGAMSVKLREGTAGWAMTTPPVTIGPDRSVADAAALMLEKGVNRLPVLDGDRLIGIVTRADLVRAFVRDDERISREIWGEVVLRGVYVSPRSLTIEVCDGEVTLAGEVETRGKAERLVEYVRLVPGVVSVRSTVTWRRDDKAPRGVPAGDRR